MRNVTADPWAGVCADELFDPTPYAGAYVRYFVRHPTTQLMPRKVKTAFDGADSDRALTGIHDIAFIARERDGVKGFEIRVGGGTSIMPRVAPTLYEFVDRRRRRVPEVAEAVLRIFDRQDWLRVNRARARIKVLVDKFGIDEMRRHGRGGARGRLGRRARLLDRGPRLPPRRGRPTRPRVPHTYGSPNGDGAEFDRFRAGQRRAAAPGGLLDRPGQGHARRPHARAVPRPRRRSCATSAAATRARPCTRTSSLRWVRDEAVYDVWQRLGELGLGDAGADEINDVVSCPGTDSCKLGITSSMGLNRGRPGAHRVDGRSPTR